MKSHARESQAVSKKAFLMMFVFLMVLVLAACGQTTQLSEGGDDGDSTKPATPSGLTASAGNAQVSLNWQANSETDLKHYNIYQGTARGDLLKVGEVAKDTQSFLASGLPNGIIHHFSIEAETTSGELSERSPEVSATPQASAASSCLFDTATSLFNSCTFGN